MKNSSFIIRLIGIVLISAVGLLVLAASAPSDLPPRPTAPPPPSNARGGLIILNVSSDTALSASTWTVVQWQDPEGDWNTVDGWQGNINNDMQVVWWVAPDDIGASSPFRWAVWDSEAGNTVLAVSEEFSLPWLDGQIINVDVTVP